MDLQFIQKLSIFAATRFAILFFSIIFKFDGAQNICAISVNVQMSPSLPMDAAVPLQYNTRKYSTDLVSQYKHATRAYNQQSPTIMSETQVPKQLRFTHQDAIDSKRPRAYFDLTSEHYQPEQKAKYQLLQQQLPQHFQPNGHWDNQQATTRSGRFSSLSPVGTYNSLQQQTQTVINRLELPALYSVTPTPQSEVHYDTQERKGWREEFVGQYSKTNKIIKTDISCQRQSLGGRLYAGARNLVTGAYEQYATSGNLILGSGLLAAAVPLAALVLPESRKRREDQDHNERPSSALFPAAKYTLQGRVDSIMGWIERSVEHLPNFPRLHPQECVKRSICEAHNEPDKYGAIGFVLRLFFPATNLSLTDRMDDMEYKVINKYRHAAGYGLNKRLDNNGTGSAVCREKYEDCLVSILDIAQNLIDIFLK